MNRTTINVGYAPPGPMVDHQWDSLSIWNTNTRTSSIMEIEPSSVILCWIIYRRMTKRVFKYCWFIRFSRMSHIRVGCTYELGFFFYNFRNVKIVSRCITLFLSCGIDPITWISDRYIISCKREIPTCYFHIKHWFCISHSDWSFYTQKGNPNIKFWE